MIRAHGFRCNGHGTAIEGLCLVVLSLSYSQTGNVVSGVSVHERESNEEYTRKHRERRAGYHLLLQEMREIV